jgi:hypothetical protein
VVEDVYLTAPDGTLVAGVRLDGIWAWTVIALGAAIVAFGGLAL